MDKNSKQEKKERLLRLKQPKRSSPNKVFREYETAKNHAKVRSMKSIDLRARFDAMFTWICLTAIVMLALILLVQVKSAKEETKMDGIITETSVSLPEDASGSMMEITTAPDLTTTSVPKETESVKQTEERDQEMDTTEEEAQG